jgi:DNA-binding MarR family transcriptional regulator
MPARDDAEAMTQIDDLMASIESLARLFSSRALYANLADRAGIAVSQQGMQILRALVRHGRQPVARLADRAHMDVAAVSRQVRILEEAGFVDRRADERDGRVAVIAATAAGARVYRRMLAAQQRQLDESLRSWSPAQRAHLAELLDRFQRDLRS